MKKITQNVIQTCRHRDEEYDIDCETSKMGQLRNSKMGPLRNSTITLFGIRIFADVIKIGTLSTTNTAVLYKAFYQMFGDEGK